jgi:hypothetical protein
MISFKSASRLLKGIQESFGVPRLDAEDRQARSCQSFK